MRHQTGIPHLCQYERQGQHRFFQMGKSHLGPLPGEAFPFCLLTFSSVKWGGRGKGRGEGNLQHLKGDLDGGHQASQALSWTVYRRQQHSTTEKSLWGWRAWKEIKPHNFKSHIGDFRFYNLTVNASFFFHNALFIFFYTKYHLLATC